MNKLCHTSLVGTYLFDLIYHRFVSYHLPAIGYTRTRSRRVLENCTHLAGTDFTAGQSFPCIVLPRSDLLSRKNRISTLSSPFNWPLLRSQPFPSHYSTRGREASEAPNQQRSAASTPPATLDGQWAHLVYFARLGW